MLGWNLFFPFLFLFFFRLLLTSINAELDDLRDLSAHGVFCPVLQIGTIFFQRVRWILIGASAVVVTVAEITLHRVYTWNQREELNSYFRRGNLSLSRDRGFDCINLICVM